MQNKIVITLIVGVALILGITLFSASKSEITENAIQNTTNAKLVLNVDIPCPGHSPLIIRGLKKLEGVGEINYSPISKFIVYYNPEQTSKEEILALEIFEEYPAKEIN